MPVTLFAITGIAVYLLVRRGSPAGGGFASFTALLMLIGVSLLTASSWPHWWTMSFPFSVSVLPPTSSIPVDVNPDIPLAFNPHPKVAIDQRVVGDMPLTDVSNGITESSQVPVTRPVPRHDGQIESKATWGWPEIVGITFLAGLTVAFVRFLLGLWIVRCYRVNSIAITDQEILELVRQNVFDLGLHRAVEVRQAHQLGSPATVGWRRPLILLPDDWKTWNQEERRVVLAHEMAHISRGDYLTWLLAQISLAFHFYHPLVHWLVRRLRFEQELAADVLGAELAGGRELYLVTLASMVLREDSPRSSWAVQSFFPNRGTFLKRIVTLSENTSLRHAAWSRGSTATLVMTMVFLGLFAAGFRVSFAEVVKAPEERPAPIAKSRANYQLSSQRLNRRSDSLWMNCGRWSSTSSDRFDRCMWPILGLIQPGSGVMHMIMSGQNRDSKCLGMIFLPSQRLAMPARLTASRPTLVPYRETCPSEVTSGMNSFPVSI